MAGGIYGAARGAAYGLRIGIAEARHLSLVMRLMAISEGAGAGAFAGAVIGGPYGAMVGLTAAALYELGNIGIDAIATRDSGASPSRATRCLSRPTKGGP